MPMHTRISDESVKEKTGKEWKEWFAILDKGGCRKMGHKTMAAWLHGRYPDVGGWWCQGITVEYERVRGIRKLYQKCDGEFAASANKTFPVPVERLFEAWTDETQREEWLPRARLTITKATPGKSVRIQWGKGESRVDVSLYAKGPEKCSASVDHQKLKDTAEVEKMKAYWSKALARLAEFVNC